MQNDIRNDSSTRHLLAAVARELLARGQSITPRALAALAGLSEEQVFELIQAGQLRTEQLPTGEHRIDPAEVSRWLARCR